MKLLDFWPGRDTLSPQSSDDAAAAVSQIFVWEFLRTPRELERGPQWVRRRRRLETSPSTSTLCRSVGR